MPAGRYFVFRNSPRPSPAESVGAADELHPIFRAPYWGSLRSRSGGMYARTRKPQQVGANARAVIF